MTDPKEVETPNSMLMPPASAAATNGVDARPETDLVTGVALPLAPSLQPKLESNAAEKVASFEDLNDVEDDDDEHRRYSVRHKSKLLVQTAESNSFDDLDDAMLPSGGAQTEMKQTLKLHTPAAKSVEIDTSETPRAALSEAVMENLDFEILPDDEDDEDDEVEENHEEEDESDPENILHRVEELSLEDDNDDVETDEEDIITSSELKQNYGMTGSASFEHHKKDKEPQAPGSPVTFKKSRSSESHNSKAPASPDGSRHRRRLSGLFTNSSQKTPLSPRRHSVQHVRSSSRSGSGDLVTTQSNDTIESTTTSDEKACKRGQRFKTLFQSTMGAIKDGMKSDASSTSTAPIDMAGDREVAGVVMDDEGSSSDESSYDEDEHWFEDEGPILFDDDIDQVVDCSTFTTLPNSFLGLPPDMYDSLDLDLVKNIKEQNVSTFAWEHHLYVKGLLQLLAERDMIGVEDDIHDSRNIIKMGVLRKKHAKSSWRVKYVEVRRGNLTYFADKENEKRKTVHLRKRTCSCKGEENKFELIVDSGKRLQWQAKSEQECQGWISAINQAMIGDTDDTRDAPIDLTTYQGAIDDFKSVQDSVKEVQTRKDYLVAMNSLLYRQSSSSALRVPMKWIRDSSTQKDRNVDAPNAPSELIKYTIRDFWENLCSTPIVLNGYLVEANSTYSADRVVGALTRCILEFDKVEKQDGFDQAFNALKRTSEDTESFITELEAVSYARSILSGALQSTGRGDLHAAVEYLFSGSDVACVKLESAEPLNIDVSFAGDDFSDDEPRPSDAVGWIDTKSKKGKKWKKRYFVSSGGVLNYFEKADPRPYGLRGQLVLHDAKISQLEGNILSIEVGEKNRMLRFEDRTDLVKWKTVFDKDKDLIDPNDPNDLEIVEDLEQDNDVLQLTNSMSPTSASNNRRRARTGSSEGEASGNLKGVRGAGAKLLKNAAGGMGKAKASANRAAAEGMKRARNAKDAGMKSIRSGAGMFIRGVRRNPSSDSFPDGRRRPTQDMLSSSTRNMTANEKREPTVQAVVELNSIFKVVTKESSDGEKENDDLLIVRVKLYQGFLLSGGQYGRLASGDELLLMEFSKPDDVEDVENEALEPPTSL